MSPFLNYLILLRSAPQKPLNATSDHPSHKGPSIFDNLQKHSDLNPRDGFHALFFTSKLSSVEHLEKFNFSIDFSIIDEDAWLILSSFVGDALYLLVGCS